jgi:hypothetical protein
MYADETGNLDYAGAPDTLNGGGASTYFGFGTAVFPATHGGHLLDALRLRARLEAEGVHLPQGFHAYADSRRIRSQVPALQRDRATSVRRVRSPPQLLHPMGPTAKVMPAIPFGKSTLGGLVTGIVSVPCLPAGCHAHFGISLPADNRTDRTPPVTPSRASTPAGAPQAHSAIATTSALWRAWLPTHAQWALSEGRR